MHIFCGEMRWVEMVKWEFYYRQHPNRNLGVTNGVMHIRTAYHDLSRYRIERYGKWIHPETWQFERRTELDTGNCPTSNGFPPGSPLQSWQIKVRYERAKAIKFDWVPSWYLDERSTMIICIKSVVTSPCFFAKADTFRVDQEIRGEWAVDNPKKFP